METKKKEKRLSAEMIAKLYRKGEKHPVVSSCILAFLVTLAVSGIRLPLFPSGLLLY